jgi:asparagine synthase (glutamine-hydrolysing)
MQNLQAQSDAYRKSFFHVNEKDLESPFFSHLPRWELTSRLRQFLSQDVKSSLSGYDPYRGVRELLPAEFEDWDPFSRAQFLEATVLLPGYILSSQGDRMAMAHSVEGRFPFLDHRVIHFAAQIPPKLRMKVLNEKYLLKRAVRSLVPPTVLSRPKQPYRAPDIVSFFDTKRGRARFSYVEELLSTDRIRAAGLFNPVAVQRLVEKAKKGLAIGVKDNMALVGILSTQIMADRFFGRQSTGV